MWLAAGIGVWFAGPKWRAADPATSGSGSSARDTYAVPSHNPGLRITGIGLDIPLASQGLRNGEINPDAGEAVWLTGNERVAPGQEGVTVVAGRVSTSGHPDVFAELHKVTVGDAITTRGPGGLQTRYTVTRAYIADKEELRNDLALWGQHTGGNRLALVTCDDADTHRSTFQVELARLSHMNTCIAHVCWAEVSEDRHQPIPNLAA